MRSGGGKAKGAQFERKICKALSLWVSEGKHTDIFWRSAMSGGRATVQHARGVSIRQAGDICAVAPEGHNFADNWFVECKNIRDMNLQAFLLANKGPIAKFWKVACREAGKYQRKPMLIIQARGPVIVITNIGALTDHTIAQLTSYARHCDVAFLYDVFADVPEAVAVIKK